VDPVYIDIGPSPSGKLTPFNVYFALSQGCSKSRIWLLRDFDDKLFTQHPSKHLRVDDKSIGQLDRETEAWWNMVVGQ
jgi:hypothetical protein